MKKLQAAMRDAASRRRWDGRHVYRVGSFFKGCHHCGDWHWEEVGNRKVKRYESGFHVYRSYNPGATTGWTWKCWECGATDLEAWEPDSAGWVVAQLGKDAIRGNRDAIADIKEFILDGGEPAGWNVTGRAKQKLEEDARRIAAIKERVAAYKLRKGKKVDFKEEVAKAEKQEDQVQRLMAEVARLQEILNKK